MIFTLPLADHHAFHLEMKKLHRRFDLGKEEHPFKIQGMWRLPLREVCSKFSPFMSNNQMLLRQKTPRSVTQFNNR